MKATTDNATTVKDLYREVTSAAILGLVVNLALGIIKLVGGLVGNSFALVVDSINSLGDAFVTVVVLIALRVAQRPPDSQHPYGHSRAEGIAATNVAVVIIVSALLMGWEAIQRLQVTHAIPPMWTLWIAAGNIAVKEALYHYKLSVGRRTGSAAMIANAWDHRSDALCSVAVLIGLILVRWGGDGWLWADEAASLVVVCAIIWSGVMLFQSSASELMDAQAGEEFVEKIRSVASAVDGVQGVEKLWVRKSGLEFFADIHIEVDPMMTVAAGHEIGHIVKDQLVQTIPALTDVLVHLEPSECPRETNAEA